MWKASELECMSRSGTDSSLFAGRFMLPTSEGSTRICVSHLFVHTFLSLYIHTYIHMCVSVRKILDRNRAAENPVYYQLIYLLIYDCSQQWNELAELGHCGNARCRCSYGAAQSYLKVIHINSEVKRDRWTGCMQADWWMCGQKHMLAQRQHCIIQISSCESELLNLYRAALCQVYLQAEI